MIARKNRRQENCRPTVLHTTRDYLPRAKTHDIHTWLKNTGEVSFQLVCVCKLSRRLVRFLFSFSKFLSLAPVFRCTRTTFIRETLSTKLAANTFLSAANILVASFDGRNFGPGSSVRWANFIYSKITE